MGELQMASAVLAVLAVALADVVTAAPAQPEAVVQLEALSAEIDAGNKVLGKTVAGLRKMKREFRADETTGHYDLRKLTGAVDDTAAKVPKYMGEIQRSLESIADASAKPGAARSFKRTGEAMINEAEAQSSEFKRVQSDSDDITMSFHKHKARLENMATKHGSPSWYIQEEDTTKDLAKQLE